MSASFLKAYASIKWQEFYSSYDRMLLICSFCTTFIGGPFIVFLSVHGYNVSSLVGLALWMGNLFFTVFGLFP